MMGEAQAVGEKLGVRFRVPMEKRIAGAEAVGKHKTSMLQDLEAGKPMEIESVLGAVIELAEMTKIDVPTLRSVYACVCSGVPQGSRACPNMFRRTRACRLQRKQNHRNMHDRATVTSYLNYLLFPSKLKPRDDVIHVSHTWRWDMH